MSSLLRIGQRVEVTGKNVQGEIAYIGTTGFQTGKWVGIILDEPKGKNNGTVQNKQYFQCKENHGTFVRQTQLTILTETGSRIDLANTGSSGASSQMTSPDDAPSMRASLTPKSRLTSSRQSLSGKSKDSRSREDMSSSTSSIASLDNQSKRSSFIEKSPTSSTPSAKGSSARTSIPQSTPRRTSIKTVPPTTKQQTGFVETLKPHFTPGQVVATPQPSPPVTALSTRSLAASEALNSREIEELKDQIKDLTEKLDTLKIRYKDKSHELQNVHLQLEQASEFKSKIMESQASLKKELERIKREKQDAIEAQEEMSDLAETLEMATLDKEMAEEKAESLQRELEQAQERIEELEMELEIIKAEMAEKSEGVATSAAELLEGADGEQVSVKMKQILQQNEKLKDTLVRLRDLSAHEKHEKQKLMKDFDEKQTDFDQILKVNDKFKARIAQMEEQIDELHAYVDAALGAEEMVDTLGQQKLELEDRVKELEETVSELEELQEINDQLQEGFKEQEHDFREELELKNNQIWEAERKTESVLESLADRELIIVKFRELVQKIQEENHELRSRLEISSKSSSLSSSLVPEMLDYKKMFAETKAHARAIELELRHMEIQQASQHVQYLLSFMPDAFLTRGSDSDAIMLVLLIPRLKAKCQVLISQLRDKYPAIATVDKASVTSALQYSAMSRFFTHIHNLQAVLHQFSHCLSTCKPETLLKAGASYMSMIQQEKVLDGYLEMLKKEKVDENLITEGLEKMVVYFNAMHPSLLLASGDCSVHQGQILADLGKAVLCAIDSIVSDINVVAAIVPEGEGVESLKKIQTSLDGLKSQVRLVKRRSEIPDLLLGENFDVSVILKPITLLSNVMGTTASRLSIMPTDLDSEVPKEKLPEIMKQSLDKHNDIIGDKDKTVQSFLDGSLEAVLSNVTNLVKTLQVNEDKYMSLKNDKEGVESPLAVRARLVKEELNAMAGIRRKMESKENDLREMRLSLRGKQEELAEMTLRKDIAEKKLANATRDLEQTIETLKRKLDEAQAQALRKEREFEATMDHLQRDIDCLETEKSELKDKLKLLPKKLTADLLQTSTTSLSDDKTLTASMIGSVTSLSSNSGLTVGGVGVGGHVDGSIGGGGPVKVIESPLLINEIKHLKSMLVQERKERSKEKAKKYMDILDSLSPIFVCKGVPDEKTRRIEELKLKLNKLEDDFINTLPTVVNLEGVKYEQWDTVLRNHIAKDEMNQREIRERTIQLQQEVANELIKCGRGGYITSDLTIFPSRQMVKAVNECKPVEIMEITLPTKDPELSGKVVPLEIDMGTFSMIRRKLNEINV